MTLNVALSNSLGFFGSPSKLRSSAWGPFPACISSTLGLDVNFNNRSMVYLACPSSNGGGSTSRRLDFRRGTAPLVVVSSLGELGFRDVSAASQFAAVQSAKSSTRYVWVRSTSCGRFLGESCSYGCNGISSTLSYISLSRASGGVGERGWERECQ